MTEYNIARKQNGGERVGSGTAVQPAQTNRAAASFSCPREAHSPEGGEPDQGSKRCRRKQSVCDTSKDEAGDLNAETSAMTDVEEIGFLTAGGNDGDSS